MTLSLLGTSGPRGELLSLTDGSRALGDARSTAANGGVFHSPTPSSCLVLCSGRDLCVGQTFSEQLK